jgi:hypothetical protein
LNRTCTGVPGFAAAIAGAVLGVGPAGLVVVGSWVMVIRLSSGLVLAVGLFVRRL